MVLEIGRFVNIRGQGTEHGAQEKIIPVPCALYPKLCNKKAPRFLEAFVFDELTKLRFLVLMMRTATKLAISLFKPGFGRILASKSKCEATGQGQHGDQTRKENLD